MESVFRMLKDFLESFANANIKKKTMYVIAFLHIELIFRGMCEPKAFVLLLCLGIRQNKKVLN